MIDIDSFITFLLIARFCDACVHLQFASPNLFDHVKLEYAHIMPMFYKAHPMIK